MFAVGVGVGVGVGAGVGVGVGAGAALTGAMVTGAVAGVAAAVGIAVIYTTVFRLFESMGNVSQLPPILAAWAPDVIFGLAGGYLILKVPT